MYLQKRKSRALGSKISQIFLNYELFPLQFYGYLICSTSESIRAKFLTGISAFGRWCRCLDFNRLC
jgi:hypothetical protein